jgi:hypothetical protein
LEGKTILQNAVTSPELIEDSELSAVSGGIWFLGYRAAARPGPTCRSRDSISCFEADVILIGHACLFRIASHGLCRTPRTDHTQSPLNCFSFL